MQAAEARRLIRRTRRIEGWISPGAALLFALIDEVQRKQGVTGGLFEIGVHHGKSAVLLCAMARVGESVGVCDLFGSQALNVSASGAGDRATFERNVGEFVRGGPGRLTVFEKASADLTPDEVGRGQRIFHVDGGHLIEESLSDIRLGADVLHEHGVIIVDDPFRADWPGVTEAILRFLQEQREFAPVVIGFNKLVLARSETAPTYMKAFTSESLVRSYIDRRIYAAKTLTIAGHPTMLFYIPVSRQIPRLEPAVARGKSLSEAVVRRLRAARRAFSRRGRRLALALSGRRGARTRR
jgi:hypothetical protein